MGWLKKFAQKNIYIFSFILVLISIGLLYICNFWIFKSNNGMDYNLSRFFAHLIPLIFVIGVCFLLGNSDNIRFHKKGIGIGILLGWPFIADAVYGFITSYTSLDKNSISFPGIEKLILFTLVMLFVGIFEEVLCRGIILNNMLNKWGYTKAGILKSVLLSSLIFGLGHLANLFGYSTPIRTLTQVIYTSLNGILFASVYLRCKNIWAVAILHAGYDWLQLVPSIFVPVVAPATQVDTSVSSMLVTGLLYVPFALVGFFLLRKVYVEDKSRAIIDIK